MMREAKRTAFVKNQKRQLKEVIDRAFDQVDDPKRDYWSNRVSAHLNRRLYMCTKDKWVPMVADMNDTQAFGEIHRKKYKQYLLMARDAAAEEVRRNKRMGYVS